MSLPTWSELTDMERHVLGRLARGGSVFTRTVPYTVRVHGASVHSSGHVTEVDAAVRSLVEAGALEVSLGTARSEQVSITPAGESLWRGGGMSAGRIGNTRDASPGPWQG